MYQWESSGQQAISDAAADRPAPPAREQEAEPELRPAARIISRGRQADDEPQDEQPEPEPEPTQTKTRPSESPGRASGRVGVAISLAATEMEIHPAQLVSCEIRVKNTGILVDQVVLTVGGPAAKWGSIEPSSINLYPDDEPSLAVVSFRPPRTPEVPAGPALFSVTATSGEDPSVSHSVTGVLTVLPYVEATTELVPLTSRGKKGAEHELTISNRGNAALAVALSASDPDEQLDFTIDPHQVLVEPGSEATSSIVLTPRKRLWVGSLQPRQFVVEGEIEQEAPLRADGRHEQLPYVPAWAAKLAAVILVPLLALATYLLLTKRIPPVVGLAEAEAEQRLEDAGFNPSFEFVQSEQIASGRVVSTEPARSEGRIRRGSDVKGFVSAGANPVTVPDVLGLDAGVAKGQLLELGLPSRPEVQDNDTVGPGQVFATEPAAGSLVPEGEQIVTRVAPGGSSSDHLGIVAFGPVDPTTGFPSWYQDATERGLQLEPCLAGLPLCSVAKDAFVGSPPNGLAYYWRAESAPINSPINGGAILFKSAVAAAFGAGQAPCDPGACAERTYSVIEITAPSGSLTPNEPYVFTHPFGTSTITADGEGGITPEIGREEVGCALQPPEPCAWDVVQTARVGPYLVWDPATAPPAPSGHVGDGDTPHLVTGSPTGNNLVRVTGPGLGEGVETNQFVVEGKISSSSAPPPGQSGILAEPESVTLPAQRAGVPSPPQIVTLNNHGDGNLQVSAVQVAGENNDDWSVASQDCTGRPISGGESCQVAVRVSPSAPGPSNAILTVVSNAFGSPHQVGLSGTGIAPTVVLDPLEIDFGTVAIGNTSAGRAVTVANAGTADLTVQLAQINQGDTGDFSIAANQCTNVLSSGQSCILRVSFHPTKGGVRNATLTLTTDGPVPGSVQDVALTGAGLAPAARFDPPELNLDTNNSLQTITVSNVGTSSLELSLVDIQGTAAGSFAIEGGSCGQGQMLQPGASCGIGVRYTPQLVGSLGTSCHRATLVVRTNEPGSPNKQLDLVGKPPLTLDCGPDPG